MIGPTTNVSLPEHVRAFALNGAMTGLRPINSDYAIARSCASSRSSDAVRSLMRAIDPDATE